MKKYLLTGSLVLLITFSISQENNNRELVEELLDLMNSSSMIDQTYTQIEQMMQSMAVQLGVNQSEQVIFDTHLARVMEMLKTEFNWGNMKEPMVDIYLSHHTEQEINNMITFYKSETGQAVIKKLPFVTKDIMLMSQNRVMDLIPKMQELEQQFKQELDAARISR